MSIRPTFREDIESEYHLEMELKKQYPKAVIIKGCKGLKSISKEYFKRYPNANSLCKDGRMYSWAGFLQCKLGKIGKNNFWEWFTPIHEIYWKLFINYSGRPDFMVLIPDENRNIKEVKFIELKYLGNNFNKNQRDWVQGYKDKVDVELMMSPNYSIY